MDHVVVPSLPWREREGGLTECGLVLPLRHGGVLTREALTARIRDMGFQAAAKITCLHCINTIARWRTWAEDPRQALEREIVFEAKVIRTRKQAGPGRLHAELRAIEQLIRDHRGEFERLVSQLHEQRRQPYEDLSSLKSGVR